MIPTLALLLAPHAFAGERLFAWTYGSGTVPQGGLELEHYLTAETHGGPAKTDWQHQVELEYGVTNNLELGLYIVGEQVGGGPLNFSAYKGRFRYRLAPVGTWPVDVAVYAEYVGFIGENSRELEEKIILERDFGKRLVTALNLTGEQVLGESGTEIVFEPTLGVGVHVVPWFSVGAEAKYEQVLGEGGPMFWAGPNAHVSGKGGRFWWTVAAMYGLTDETRADAEWEVRSLLAVNL